MKKLFTPPPRRLPPVDVTGIASAIIGHIASAGD